MTHDYKRNGTTTLFTALDVLTGKVIGQCLPRHRHTEFLIEAYLNAHNADPKPYVWTATAESILAKVQRARTKLEQVVNQNRDGPLAATTAFLAT